MNAHDSMLDDVAAYALGVLPPAQSRAVAAHLETCEECRQEYRQIRPAVTAVGISAEACFDAASAAESVAPPGPLLKKRIMRQIRPNVAEMRAVRPIVWPAYAVAAACLVVALVSGIINISLNSQVHQLKNESTQMASLVYQLRRGNSLMRTALADLIAPDSQRYTVANGEVVKRSKRLYIALNALPPPPKGKVYQAWTLHTGATQMTPSVTFVPTPSGIAVVPVPGDASQFAAVAVSVEPEGGSKQPTSKPTFVLKFS